VGAEAAPPHAVQRKPTPVVRKQTRERRPWETMFRLSGGFRFIDRRVEITDPSSPELGLVYRSGLAPAMTFIDGELFPWASQGGPVLSRIGATLRYYRTLSMKDSGPMETALYQVDVGLLYRWHLFDRITSPTLRFGVEYGMLGLENSRPVMPDITYEYLRLRILDLEWPLLHRGRFVLGLSARFHYLGVLAEGEITSSGTRGFGPSDTGAIELGGGLFGSVGGFYFTLSGSYQRFFLDFQASCPSFMADATCRSAGGAVDETADLSLGLGFIY
jgi:hypothetical protein